MKVDLLTVGGIYLKTFKSINDTAKYFLKRPAYIEQTIKKNKKIKHNGVFYRLRWSEDGTT